MKAFAALVLFAVAALAHAEWLRSTEVWTQDGNSKRPVAVFFSTVRGAGDGITSPSCGTEGWCQPVKPPDTWVTQDLAGLGVPADAKAVFLSGLLIVTHGYTSELCGLTVTFRAPDDALEAGAFQLDAIETALGGGQRSTAALWVPVKNGQLQVNWHRYGAAGDWPSYCAVGLNLSLQAWTR